MLANTHENDDEERNQQQHQLPVQQQGEEAQTSNRSHEDEKGEQVALLSECSSELLVVQQQVLELEQKLREQQQASATTTCQSSPVAPDHLDDASLLELFLLSVKEKLLQSVPPTDAQCGFDIVTGKCTPMCHCEFRPKWGDYAPARACRLIPSDRLESMQCDANKLETPWVVKLVQVVGRHAGKATERLRAKVVEMAPPTHEDCRFSLKSLKCEPSDLCIWDFHPGDFSLDRACRYRVDKLD